MAFGTGLLTLTACFAVAIVSYAGFAGVKGWPVGEWYQTRSSFPMVMAGLALPAAPIAGAVLFPWWTALIIVVAGILCGLTVTRLIRHHVQYIAPVGLIVCWVLVILTVLP